MSEDQSQLELMAVRRERLKEWFSDRTLPKKEKSALSQLIRGGDVFGPRVARRLENTYGMPRGYLDGLSPEDAQTFGNRIRTLRKERNLTQLQLADYVGVSQAAVAAWEAGKRGVDTGDHLQKLAEALGFTAEELEVLVPEKPKESIEEVHLLAAFRSLPRERQLLAIRLLEALR